MKASTAIAPTLSCFLAAIPPAILIHFLATTGTGIPSSDAINYFQVIEKVLEGNYRWTNYFYDTFVPMSSGHSGVFPVAANLLAALLFSWNVYAVLYFGVFLALLKLVLLFSAFTRSDKGVSRWLLLPLLSLLVFSPSQLSVFEFELTSMQYGFYQFGLSLGLWGLAKYGGVWKGLCVAGAGGTVASWSYGAGPMCWPVFLAMLWFIGERRWRSYFALAMWAYVASFPYIYFLVLRPHQGPYATETFRNYILLPRSLGWPFSSRFSEEQATFRGAVGWALLVLGIAFCLVTSSPRERRRAAPALALALFFILQIIQLTIFRSGFLYWYNGAFLLGWIAMLGLAYFFWTRPSVETDRLELARWNVGRYWAASLVFTALFFFLTSNLAFEGKSFFLDARSPVAESCMRYYDRAPTMCHEMVVRFPAKNTFMEMSDSFRRHRLAAFGPSQVWSLQGDYILSSVVVSEQGSSQGVKWVESTSGEGRSFRDFRRLDLWLSSLSAVEWTVALPKGLKSAEFRSAVAAASLEGDSSRGSALLDVSIRENSGKYERVFSRFVQGSTEGWVPIRIPLERYAGRSVSIVLSVRHEKGMAQAAGLFRYPHVVLRTDEDPGRAESLEIAPENVDIASVGMPKEGEGYFFPVDDHKRWRFSEISPSEDGVWKAGFDPHMIFDDSLNLNLREFSHFFIRIAASSAPRWGYKISSPPLLQVYYSLAGEEGLKVLDLPLLGDGKPHSYFFDLRLLELPRDAVLNFFRLDPIIGQDPPGKGSFMIESVGFLKKWKKAS